MLFPTRNRLALALTFGLHALLVLFWLQAPRPRLADAPQASSVVSVLLNVPLPATVAAPPPAVAPSSPARAPARHVPPATTIPKPASFPDTTPSPAALGPLPQAAPASSLSASSATSTASEPDAADPAAPSDTGLALDLARRQAGRIDRELRMGKSGVPAEANTPWARFQRGLESAHVGNLVGEQMDSYTAPDGVVFYRRKIGKRTICRRSGSVGPGIAGMRGINDAGDVPCPGGAVWKRD